MNSPHQQSPSLSIICPACEHVFQADTARLSASYGWVDCPACTRVFSADQQYLPKNTASFNLQPLSSSDARDAQGSRERLTAPRAEANLAPAAAPVLEGRSQPLPRVRYGGAPAAPPTNPLLHPLPGETALAQAQQAAGNQSLRLRRSATTPFSLHVPDVSSTSTATVASHAQYQVQEGRLLDEPFPTYTKDIQDTQSTHRPLSQQAAPSAALETQPEHTTPWHAPAQDPASPTPSDALYRTAAQLLGLKAIGEPLTQETQEAPPALAQPVRETWTTPGPQRADEEAPPRNRPRSQRVMRSKRLTPSQDLTPSWDWSLEDSESQTQTQTVSNSSANWQSSATIQAHPASRITLGTVQTEPANAAALNPAMDAQAAIIAAQSLNADLEPTYDASIATSAPSALSSHTADAQQTQGPSLAPANPPTNPLDFSTSPRAPSAPPHTASAQPTRPDLNAPILGPAALAAQPTALQAEQPSASQGAAAAASLDRAPNSGQASAVLSKHTLPSAKPEEVAKLLDWLEESQPRPLLRRPVFYVTVVLALALCLASLLSERDRAAAIWPSLRTPLQGLCYIAACTVEDYRDLNAIELDGTTLTKQPDNPNRYLLEVTLVNKAHYTAVALPSLEITLTDFDGKAIVSRRLSARELGFQNKTLAPLATQKSEFLVDIALSPDQQLRMENYVVRAFYGPTTQH